MQLSFRGASVRLRAGYADDVASQVLPAVLEGADDMTVTFNPSYLVDALSSFDAQHVRFHLLGPGQRALLIGAVQPGHRHLVMSLKHLVRPVHTDGGRLG
ncbi:hypothetical protein [Streptomyces sp. NBC_00390]|uniref:hypothetical protein n=1 Tax=Streptomyces sp. NBC_00390 TaxID=2975736 RepID=UPI003FCD1B55